MSKPTANELLAAYRQRRSQSLGRQKIRFHGVEGLDVYNPTKPFLFNQQWVMAARVEARDSEFSQVKFFTLDNFTDAYLLKGAPVFELQDPFVCFVAGEMIFGGVEVALVPGSTTELTWRTRFWRGRDLFSLCHFADGPQGMKDIRLVNLPDGRLLVFTRPQGETGGRGTIGWVIIDSLNNLMPATIENAQLLDQVDSLSWCGVNEAWLISEFCIGVLAHVACFDDQGNRHYYAATFHFDLTTWKSTDITIIAERADFLAGDAKRDDLVDVVFPGGIFQISGFPLMIFCGTSDCEVQWLLMSLSL